MNSMEPACCTPHPNKPEKSPRSFYGAWFPPLKHYFPAALSLILLLVGFYFEYFLKPNFFTTGNFKLWYYIVAYIPVGVPVLRDAWVTIRQGDVFNEFVLMSIATVGAFLIGKYAEGVSVMLFYTLGELFQDAAVHRSRGNIKALLDVRPKIAHLQDGDQWRDIHPSEVQPGDLLLVRAGEKIPVDATLETEEAFFDTSALTGESRPRKIRIGETVLSGMLNTDKVVHVRATRHFKDSSLSKILQLVEEASAHKAKTELYIRKFAKVYTPVVFFLAVVVMLLPALFMADYQFKSWFYRGLIFLVIACPCALLISIPLGYFGGIGAASRNGILVKGSNFLDLLAKLDTVVTDKTGTLTKGVFTVQDLHATQADVNTLLDFAAAVESHSNHPIAKAIVDYHKPTLSAENVEEVQGLGLKGQVQGKEVLVGNAGLFEKFQIKANIPERTETTVLVAVDGYYAGYITIADEIKEDTVEALQKMRKRGVSRVIMLSGDQNSIVQKTAKKLQIDEAYGNLLPKDKVRILKEIKQKAPEKTVAFVGDGLNDAPVLAASDIGLAMGALGSDAAIETADVIIQTDEISKIPTAIRIGRKTREIVVQNIVLAFGVKILVLILGAFGLATMWEAVFADVGVAFLAILNAIRIQRMNFEA